MKVVFSLAIPAESFTTLWGSRGGFRPFLLVTHCPKVLRQRAVPLKAAALLPDQGFWLHLFRHSLFKKKIKKTLWLGTGMDTFVFVPTFLAPGIYAFACALKVFASGYCTVSDALLFATTLSQARGFSAIAFS